MPVARTPAERVAIGCAMVFAFFMLSYTACYACLFYWPQTRMESSGQSTRSEGPFINSATFGCLTSGQLRQLTNLARRDPRAHEFALSRVFASGECIVFSRGDPVHLLSRGNDQRLVRKKIALEQADVKAYWIPEEKVTVP